MFDTHNVTILPEGYQETAPLVISVRHNRKLGILHYCNDFLGYVLFEKGECSIFNEHFLKIIRTKGEILAKTLFNLLYGKHEQDNDDVLFFVGNIDISGFHATLWYGSREIGIFVYDGSSSMHGYYRVKETNTFEFISDFEEKSNTELGRIVSQVMIDLDITGKTIVPFRTDGLPDDFVEWLSRQDESFYKNLWENRYKEPLSIASDLYLEATM